MSFAFALVSLIGVPSAAILFIHDHKSWTTIMMFISQIVMLWPIVRKVSDEEWLVEFLNPNTDPFFPFIVDFYDWAKKWARIIAYLILIDLGYSWIGFWMIPIVLVTIVTITIILYKIGETGSRLAGE